jgi:signal transduction histidine kinase
MVHDPAAAVQIPGTEQVVPLSGVSSDDVAFARSRRQVVVVGQFAMALLVVFATAALLAVTWPVLSTLQTVTTLAASAGLIGWSIWGTRRIYTYFGTSHRSDHLALDVLGKGWWRAVLFFAVEYGFIASIYAVAIDLGELRYLWLILLPPVGQAVLSLSLPAAVVVSVISTGILSYAALAVYGGAVLPGALIQFGLALAFTMVFAHIAVSSEKARAEVALLANKLTALNRRLGEYAIQAEELAATRERNQLARDIHDSVGHVLTAVNIQLSAARAMVSHDTESACQAIDKAQALTKQGLADIRSSVAALRLSPIENRSLPTAIGELVQSNDDPGCRATLRVSGTPRALAQTVATALYRAAQEGITNARKHAGAQEICIELDYRQKDSVRLAIVDDGGGADGLSGGFGLIGLRERAEILGGELNVQSSPGKGFQLTMRLPA